MIANEREKIREERSQEYQLYRQILKCIAMDPDEPGVGRIEAIRLIFEFDDRKREYVDPYTQGLK